MPRAIDDGSIPAHRPPSGRRGRSRHRFDRRSVGVVLVLTTAATLARPTAVTGQDVATAVRSDADWILSAQLPDGSIANYVDRQAIWPYLSNFAAMGLARATEVTGDARYLDAAWKWLGWYQAHEDTQGFVTDYSVQNGVPVSTGFMDSTDSYAGTYLLAVRAAYRVGKDRAKVTALTNGIRGAVRAIEATQATDGLTWAKPTWKVKYLMDQGETYGGLLAGAELATVLGDSTLSQKATSMAGRMKSGVDQLWRSTSSSYDWAVHEDGARTPNNWAFLYSDALQQAWAVAFGITDAIRGNLLLTTFNTQQPAWAQPAATALFSGNSTQTVGYWPMAGLGFSNLSSTLASGAVLSIRSAAINANRAWPFTTANAGQLIMYESYTRESSILTPLPSTLLAAPTTTTTRPATATTTTTRLLIALPATTTTTKPPTTTTTKAPATTTTTRNVRRVLVGIRLGSLASLELTQTGQGLAVNTAVGPGEPGG